MCQDRLTRFTKSHIKMQKDNQKPIIQGPNKVKD
jgi:hypothetical protein